MKIFSAILCLGAFCVSDSFCQIEKLISVRWKVTQQVAADFNMDGLKDYFVVLDSLDNKSEWLVSKRILQIFYGSNNGFYSADKNALVFLDKTKMVEPDLISLTAKENVIQMGLGDLTLFGGRNCALGYTFRLQNGKWYCIGCSWSCERVASDDGNTQIMDGESFSYNFVTGKFEHIVTSNSKIRSKRLVDRAIKLPLFSEFTGECNESVE